MLMGQLYVCANPVPNANANATATTTTTAPPPPAPAPNVTTAAPVENTPNDASVQALVMAPVALAAVLLQMF